MEFQDIKILAAMNVKETATDGYDIMFAGFENVPEDHKRKCIEETLMPMIRRHKSMAEELLIIREGLDRLLEKLENSVNDITKPDTAND